jgi:hypothetical protein
MRQGLFALSGALFLAACGGGAPNPYPDQARAQFETTCPRTSAVCTCTWDHITHDLTYEEYQAALARYRRDGLMDPRITHARAVCLEAHPHS